MQLLQCSVFRNLLRTFAALQVLLEILLLIWGASEYYEIVVKTLNFGYSVWSNSFFFFFVLFRSGHFHNVVQLDVENENVVLTLSDVVHVNVEIHNVDSTLLDATLFQRWFDVVPCHDVPSTKRQRWSNVEMFDG